MGIKQSMEIISELTNEMAIDMGLMTAEEKQRIEKEAEFDFRVDMLSEEDSYLTVDGEGNKVRREKEDLVPF